MAVKCTGEERVLTLYLSGEVDHHGAGVLMKELDQILESRLPKAVTLDLSGISFMDSSGIAVMLRVFKRMKAAGGSVKVQGVPTQADRVLKTAGLDKLMPFD